MTEKRFTYGYGGITYEMVDGSYNCSANLEEICTWLNELHEENRGLQRHLDVMRSGALTDDKRIKELYDENKQLKKENKGIQDKVWKLLELLEKKGIDKRKIIKWWNGDTND